MGFSRDTFYRIKKAYGEGGIEALYEKSRRKPNFKNRVSEEGERAVVELALEDPSLGQKRVSDELRKRGIFVKHLFLGPVLGSVPNFFVSKNGMDPLW